MSSPPVRRADKVMPDAKVDDLLSTGYCGHLATISPDGSPYVCPLLYVWLAGQVWLHNTSAHGHLQNNVRHDPRVCFEISVPGKVFAYGRYECDTSIEYQSIVVFGRAAIIDDRPRKSLFFDALMAKYYGNDSNAPEELLSASGRSHGVRHYRRAHHWEGATSSRNRGAVAGG